MSGGAQIALVTGAASGIGRATALEFARAGACVALVDVNHGGAQEVAREIESGGGRASAHAADLSRSDEIRRAVRELVELCVGDRAALVPEEHAVATRRHVAGEDVENHASVPPSAVRAAPLIMRASSDARNAMMPAMSDGSAKLPGFGGAA